MKTKTNILGALLIILLVSVACGSKRSPSGSEVNTGILSSHGWKLQNLQVDNVDKTSLYTGMTLSFTPTAYTTSNGVPVWAASGSWSFAGSDGKTIVRDDHLQVSVDQISDAQLVLSLTWNENTLGGGRESSVAGKHVYTFVK